MMLATTLVVAASLAAGGGVSCVPLTAQHLPEVVRGLELGVTTPEQVRAAFSGEGTRVEERWDSQLGGEKTLVVEGLESMTPNYGAHYGEISFVTGAANREEYLQLGFRFTGGQGSEPVLYSIAVTTRADSTPSTCEPAAALAGSVKEQRRPKKPSNVPPPRVTSTGYTFYPCLKDGRTVIVKCSDGAVKITFNGVQYPIRTVEYELIVGE